MARALKYLAAAVTGIAVFLGVAFLAYRYWPRTPPDGQPGLATLESLQPVTAAFNEGHGRPRLLVLLSPTCPKCVAGAGKLGDLLAKVGAANLRTVVIWMPVIQTDIAPPTSSKLALLPGSEVRQFWDPKHLVSQQLLALGRANLGRLPPDQRELVEQADVAWDVLALFPQQARWDAAMPPWPRVWGFPVEDSLLSLGQALSDSRPGL